MPQKHFSVELLLESAREYIGSIIYFYLLAVAVPNLYFQLREQYRRSVISNCKAPCICPRQLGYVRNTLDAKPLHTFILRICPTTNIHMTSS